MNNRARNKRRAGRLIKVHYGGYYTPLLVEISAECEATAKAIRAIADAVRDVRIRLWHLRNRPHEELARAEVEEHGTMGGEDGRRDGGRRERDRGML